MKEKSAKNKRVQTVLIVDDSALNREILASILEGKYNILFAEDGAQALSYIQEYGNTVSLILLDIHMPNMNGMECLEALKNNGWLADIPVIMISSETKVEMHHEAYKLGASEFIVRPFDEEIVKKRVHNTLSLYAKQNELLDMVEAEVVKREHSVSSMIMILSQIMEFRNGESARHVFNVNKITELLLNTVYKKQKTTNYRLTPESISLIKLASSLHDIGKIVVPEEILNKPGKLSAEEFEIIKKHSSAGADMLQTLCDTSVDDPIISISRDICRWHHERWDGKGYPDGLVGDDIPLSAQVVAIADVYDALTSKRCYKEAYSHEKSIEMIMNGECGTFNPFLLECLNDIKEVIPFILEQSNSIEKSTKEIIQYTFLEDEIEEVMDINTPPSRTITLMEYERMKYTSFAEMSNEIQFEYTFDTNVATIHDYAEQKIGLPVVLKDPLNEENILAIFSSDDIQYLREQIKKATADNPKFSFDVFGQVEAGQIGRWFHLEVKTLWNIDGEKETMLGLIGKLIDIHDSRERMSELEQKATCDSLTGLYNHKYAKQLINQRFRENPDGIFTLMVFDMDKFKNANDDYGHSFGDAVLQYLAKVIQSSVRHGDITSRLGGDEFMICMETDIDPKPLVERIYKQLTCEYEGFPIRISMGVDISYGKDKASYEERFDRADNALYEKKRNGRGGYVYSDAVTTNYEATALSAIDSNEEEQNN